MLRQEDALLDFGPWHRLLRAQLWVFLANLLAFSMAYFWLEWQMDEPRYFEHFQVKLSHFFVIVIFAQVSVIVGFNWKLFKGVLASFIFRETSPYNLAFARIVTMGMITQYLRTYVPETLAHSAALPFESREALPLVGWMVNAMPISPDLYEAMTVLASIFCICAALGLFTRISLILSVLSLFYVLGVPNFFGKLGHSHFLLWWPAFLAFAPAGEVWSLDAWIKKLRGKPLHTQANFRYGVAMKLAFLQLGMLYFFSAIGKLWMGGLEWVLSDNLVHLMRLEWLEHYAIVPDIRLDQYPILCRILAMGVVLFELSYLFLILTPRYRIATALSAVGFHFSTEYFLRIGFPFLQLLNVLHVDWHGLMRRFAYWKPLAWGIGLALMLGYATWFWNAPFCLAFLLLTGGLVWKRYRKPKAESVEAVPKPLSKWLWYVGVVILAANFGFGFMQTSSWPFSAYPSYSFVREGTVKYIWFVPGAIGGDLSLDEMAQKEGFSKEDVLPMAETAVNLWEQERMEDFEKQVGRLWLVLREKVPELKGLESTEVVFQKLSTDPDRIPKVLEEWKIGALVLEAGEWKWKRE